MCESYVAAGLPPERFWTITPRLYVTEMNGALARIRRERGLVWESAFLPWQKKAPSLSEFIGMKPKAHSPDVLDMMIRNSTKGLKGISMSEALRSMH